MISAKIICDSISTEGHRLTTFVLRYPKFIHGELMTHRVFSRNASSSRAIPVSKYLEEVRSDELRAEPAKFGKNRPGMQATEWFEGNELDAARARWRRSALRSADEAEADALAGEHKQTINRKLDPYIHINVVLTATEYMNFFGLRLDRAADPTMRALAEVMWDAYNESRPTFLRPGEWHLPFVGDDDIRNSGWATINHGFKGQFQEEFNGKGIELLIRVSVARCARVSYTSFETGKPSTVEEDLKLYDKLVGAQPMHASPAEHQATPDEEIMDMMDCPHGWKFPRQHGNFTGWRQYRKMLPGESNAWSASANAKHLPEAR